MDLKSKIQNLKLNSIYFFIYFQTNNYNKVIINAVYEIWPQTQIIGCKFHLTQTFSSTKYCYIVLSCFLQQFVAIRYTDDYGYQICRQILRQIFDSKL